MIERYQHTSDNDVINAILEKNGKAPSSAPKVKIKEADKLNVVDQGMLLGRLKEENAELKQRLETMEKVLSDLETKQEQAIDSDIDELIKKVGKENFQKAMRLLSGESEAKP